MSHVKGPCVGVCSVIQSCLTLCDPMDCSPPGSSVHGILQAWILEWDCHVLLHGIFLIQGWSPSLLYLLHWQVGSLPSLPPGKPRQGTTIFIKENTMKKLLKITEVTLSTPWDCSPMEKNNMKCFYIFNRVKKNGWVHSFIHSANIDKAATTFQVLLQMLGIPPAVSPSKCVWVAQAWKITRKKHRKLITGEALGCQTWQIKSLSYLYALLYLKWVTNKDLLYNTWNSAQCYVTVWMGGSLRGVKNGYMYMDGWVLRCWPETTTLLIGYVKWKWKC